MEYIKRGDNCKKIYSKGGTLGWLKGRKEWGRREENTEEGWKAGGGGELKGLVEGSRLLVDRRMEFKDDGD